MSYFFVWSKHRLLIFWANSNHNLNSVFIAEFQLEIILFRNLVQIVSITLHVLGKDLAIMYIVACQKGGVSNKLPVLRAATRHGPLIKAGWARHAQICYTYQAFSTLGRFPFGGGGLRTFHFWESLNFWTVFYPSGKYPSPIQRIVLGIPYPPYIKLAQSLTLNSTVFSWDGCETDELSPKEFSLSEHRLPWFEVSALQNSCTLSLVGDDMVSGVWTLITDAVVPW